MVEYVQVQIHVHVRHIGPVLVVQHVTKRISICFVIQLVLFS